MAGRTHDGYSPEGGTAAAHAPTDETEERVKAFDAHVLPCIRDAVDRDALLDAAASQFSVERDVAEERFDRWEERYDVDIVTPATTRAATTALDRYLLQHDRYTDDMNALVEEALTEAAQHTFPAYLFRDGVTKLYDGADIHPGRIQRDVARSLSDVVDDVVDDPTTAAAALLHDRPVPVDAVDGPGATGDALRSLHSGAGEEGLHATWNADHPAVIAAAAEALLDDLGRQVQRLHPSDPEQAAYVQELQDAYRTTLDRVKAEATMEVMEERWGRGDLPYEVFEINDADEMLRAARAFGNCRARDRDRRYYELLEEDPYTTVLGVRRFDDHHWIGATRCFHLATPEGETVFGIDNLGMPYRDDDRAEPMEGCDFENYGDALPVMGLAAMRYGFDHGFDHVVAAGGVEGEETFPDMRVGGGPGDWIGPAHLYGQHGTRMHLEKPGTRTEGEPYGFGQPRGPTEGYVVRRLLENPERLT